VFCTLSHAWHTFLGFAQRESKPAPLLKRKQQLDSNSAEESRPALKRLQIIQNHSAALALPMHKGVAREEEEKREVEDAIRQVLRIPQGTPVTYKSPAQKAALNAVVQGVSPLIIVLPTGGGKTLLPIAAAILNDIALQESSTTQPNITILIVP
jgi:predicted ribonuclease YlaK